MADLRADPEFDDRKISQSLIVGLLVLTSFHGDGNQTVTAISIDIGQSASTTLRYLKTWVAVGVLEQDPTDHSYRLAQRWREELTTGGPPPPPPPPSPLPST